MSVSTPAPPPATKRPSRSNSISSSIVTIKKSASVSSRTGPRTSYLRNRSTSPDSISRVLHSLNSSRSDFRGRTDTLESTKPNAPFGANRWSHSTSSSLSAIDADLIRKRTSSIRRSVGPAHTANNSISGPQVRNSQDYKVEARASPKRSSSTGHRVATVPGSRLAFRDSSNLNIVQGQSQSSNNSNASVAASTWEQNSGVNKFGEPVQSLSIHYTTSATPADKTSSVTSSTTDKGYRINETSTIQARQKPAQTGRSRDNTNGATTPLKSQSSRSNPPGNGETRSPRRRDMLSKALAKANEAVLLDNAQNVNAAIEAYNEACELLQQVMVRSADLADRKKLSSIKATYSRRIAELHDFDNTFEDLMRPSSGEPPEDGYENPEDFYQEDGSYQATAINDAPAIQLPLRQESLLPEIFGGDNYIHDHALPTVRNPLPNSRLMPMDEQYMPPPLSPRPLFASQPEDQVGLTLQSDTNQPRSEVQQTAGTSAPSTWLDQTDDGSSNASSRLSSVDYGPKEDQLLSEIDAEFDAMNAAVDSAYDDNIDQEATPRVIEKTMSLTGQNRFNPLTGTFLDDDAEDEEQLLDNITVDSDFNESQQTITALPRQSDSSGFSNRTWGSSVASTTATTRTTLSTLAETIEPPIHAPPTGALPEPPRSSSKVPESETAPSARPMSSGQHVGIRDRRMSGQSAKQLKIETFIRRSSIAQQSKPLPNGPASTEDSTQPAKDQPMRTLAPAASFSSSLSGTQPLTPMLSIHSAEVHSDESPATPALTYGGSTDESTLMDPSPSRHGRMMPPPAGPITRKNLSTSNLGKGSLSINTVQLEADSPMTPGSAMFSIDSRKPGSAVTSATSAVSNPGTTVLTSMGLGGLYLLEDHIGDSRGTGSTDHGGDPIPLEPCPHSYLLRPFWLMRCLYQALSHPKGGYISNKLFIPRDIWRVRNVKIKALDDKIAQCDLLTAALQKLAKVDTLDANAVLEELQSFETILDQVRLMLTKKLGSDVGLSGSSSVFKASPAAEEANESLKSATASSAAKSFASGWRKLRSKSSSANLTSTIRTDVGSQSHTMASLPMTSSSSVATSRSYLNTRKAHPPPTPSALPQLLAPHAHYISTLARLFDAVQVLDSIARQVEDPGLKCSSQTHVGLELSVRNAAEFFAFYIIRFVMSDLLMLLDKFLKRGGEWVMT